MLYAGTVAPMKPRLGFGKLEEDDDASLDADDASDAVGEAAVAVAVTTTIEVLYSIFVRVTTSSLAAPAAAACVAATEPNSVVEVAKGVSSEPPCGNTDEDADAPKKELELGETVLVSPCACAWDEDVEDWPSQAPRAGLQPLPQCSGVTPQKPNLEQQRPKAEPAQVMVPPQTPSFVGVREPEVELELELEPEFGLEPELAEDEPELEPELGLALELGEDELEPEPELELGLVPELEEDEPVEPHDPLGALVPLLLFSVTSAAGPGSGNLTSFVSTVAHPLLTFATNIFGRAAKATGSAAPAPALMVTLAQFMYISRLPTLLNQVQAKTAGPAGVSAGTAKDQSATSGQLPM
jgi:hypothetical protein